MCRSRPGTPTRAPRCATTGHARTSTGIPTTSWPPTWPPAPDRPGSAYTIGCIYHVVHGPALRGGGRTRSPVVTGAPERPRLRPGRLPGRPARRAGREPRRALHPSPGREGPRAAVPPASTADPRDLLARARPPDHPADGIPQDPQCRSGRGRSCLTSAEDLRARARTSPRHLRPRGILR